VLDISPASGTVTVGPAESLDVLEIEAQRPVWTGCPPPAAPIGCLVQLRAHGAACPATVTPEGTGLRIRLAEPARGIASGQAAVFYDGSTVLGSATITGTGRTGISRTAPADRPAGSRA
jgi:tRNA-specific 2-thiouridylase